MQDDLTQILRFVYQFTIYPLPLHEYPAPELEGIEWFRMCDKIKSDWVAEAPDHWLNLLIGLVADPPTKTQLPAIGWQDEEDRDDIIAELLGLWGQKEPGRFFTLIAPRLEISQKRRVFINAVGETFLPQALDYLRPLAGHVATLDDDEAIALIDSIGDVARHTVQQCVGLELVERIRASIEPGRKAVIHEINVYLQALGEEAPTTV